MLHGADGFAALLSSARRDRLARKKRAAEHGDDERSGDVA